MTRWFPTAALAALLSMLVGLVGCSSTAPWEGAGPHVVAGGGVSGVYYGYGSALADVLSEDFEVDVQVIETAGSIDNLQRIGRGEAMAGFTQSDAAADAVHGRGAFAESVPIWALARLYDEYVHVVVRAESAISELVDLAGRRVSLGAPGSGVHVVSARILDAAGVGPVDDRELDLADSLVALESGEIDAFFWVGAVPTPTVSALGTDVALRLVPIPAAVVDTVGRQHPGVYRFADLPVSAYDWAAPTKTLAVPNYLVVAESMDPDLARRILATLFDARSQLTARVPAAALLDRRSAIFTDSLELHDGAVAYYREQRR